MQLTVMFLVKSKGEDNTLNGICHMYRFVKQRLWLTAWFRFSVPFAVWRKKAVCD